MQAGCDAEAERQAHQAGPHRKKDSDAKQGAALVKAKDDSIACHNEGAGNDGGSLTESNRCGKKAAKEDADDQFANERVLVKAVADEEDDRGHQDDEGEAEGERAPEPVLGVKAMTTAWASRRPNQTA